MDKKDLFRSNIAFGIEAGKKGIDREFKHDKGVGVIYGYAVITKGKLNEADIRKVEMDDQSLSQIVELGNAAKFGVKSRFGHPNMSSEALGTFLGRAKNFRIDGDIVRADLYLDSTAYKTPHGDLATYVLNLAENDPDSFGSSIVFHAEQEIRLNEDTTPKKDSKGNQLPALMRFKKLFASDIVDDPAATKGLFATFFTESVRPSAEMTSFLDRFLNTPDAVEKVSAFLERYRINRTEVEGRNTNQEEVTSMEIKDVTLEMLRAERPELVEALKTEGKVAGLSEGETLGITKGKELGIAEGKQAGITEERTRVIGVLETAKAFPDMADQAFEAVKNGDTADDALSKFKAQRLEELKKKAPASPGPGDDPSKGLDSLPLEERCKVEFDADPKLRSEFGTLKTYTAFKKAESEGKAKILKK